MSHQQRGNQPVSFLTVDHVKGAVVDAVKELVRVESDFDPNAQLSIDHFESHTSRVYDIELRCTLNQLASGLASPVIKCAPGAEHIYQRIEGYLPDGKPVYAGDKGKGLILDMWTEEFRSTFPVDFGLVNHQMVGNDCKMSTGRNYLATFWGKTSRSWKPGEKSIFSPKYPTTFKMLQDHNNISVEALESYCHYSRVPGAHVIVDVISPLTDMMVHNANVFGIDFSNLDLTKPGRFEAPAAVVEACMAKYNEAITPNFVDFNKFSFDFERADGLEWNSKVGVEDNGSRTHNGKGIMDRTFEFKAKIGMKTVLYGR